MVVSIAWLISIDFFSSDPGMGKFLHGVDDLGHPLNAFQGLLDGMGNLRLHVFEVCRLGQGIESLQRLWRNRPEWASCCISRVMASKAWNDGQNSCKNRVLSPTY
jgi:hypothetical protein